MKRMIVFSGLPGAGKSSLAEAVGREFEIPVFAKDLLEATLVRSNLVQNNKDKLLGMAGYELLTTLAENQFILGQSVILDCVTSTKSIRDSWRDLSSKYEAKWLVVECVCTDKSIHRVRLENRIRGISGWYEIEWQDIERVKSYFEPWDEPRLIIDSIQPLKDNIASVIQYCS